MIDRISRAVAAGFSLQNSELQTQNPELRTLPGVRQGGPNSELKAVAKEMEAMFVYQMLKAMRETTNSGFFGKGLGNETYTSLFDMELARLFAERGLGLGDMVLKALTKTDEPIASNELPSSLSSDSSADLRFPVEGRISSWFGMRQDPFTGEEKFHHGIDIAAPEGREIFPVKNGKVIFSGYLPRYGNTVIIEHEDGFISKYAHNMVNLVSAGEYVGPGHVIALVGSTGRATGPHLHFEVKYKGENIDPLGGKLWARKQ